MDFTIQVFKLYRRRKYRTHQIWKRTKKLGYSWTRNIPLSVFQAGRTIPWSKGGYLWAGCAVSHDNIRTVPTSRQWYDAYDDGGATDKASARLWNKTSPFRLCSRLSRSPSEWKRSRLQLSREKPCRLYFSIFLIFRDFIQYLFRDESFLIVPFPSVFQPRQFQEETSGEETGLSQTSSPSFLNFQRTSVPVLGLSTPSPRSISSPTSEDVEQIDFFLHSRRSWKNSH